MKVDQDQFDMLKSIAVQVLDEHARRVRLVISKQRESDTVNAPWYGTLIAVDAITGDVLSIQTMQTYFPNKGWHELDHHLPSHVLPILKAQEDAFYAKFGRMMVGF